MVERYTLQAEYNLTLPIFPGPASHMEDVCSQLMIYNEPLTRCTVLTENGKDISVEDAHNVIR